jgi:hypothetical protein
VPPAFRVRENVRKQKPVVDFEAFLVLERQLPFECEGVRGRSEARDDTGRLSDQFVDTQELRSFSGQLAVESLGMHREEAFAQAALNAMDERDRF